MEGYYPWPQWILGGLYPSRGLLFYTNGPNYCNSNTFLIRTPKWQECLDAGTRFVRAQGKLGKKEESQVVDIKGKRGHVGVLKL